MIFKKPTLSILMSKTATKIIQPYTMKLFENKESKKLYILQSFHHLN